jgi:hypothetical protein
VSTQVAGGTGNIPLEVHSGLLDHKYIEIAVTFYGVIMVSIRPSKYTQGYSTTGEGEAYGLDVYP